MARKIYKNDIIALRKSDPDLSYREIADRLGCSIRTVWTTCSYTGLHKGRPKVFRNVIALGWAAQRAGLTVQQIEAMDARDA